MDLEKNMDCSWGNDSGMIKHIQYLFAVVEHNWNEQNSFEPMERLHYKIINTDNLKLNNKITDTKVIYILYQCSVCKVCIAQLRYQECNFDAVYVFTVEFFNSSCAVFKLSCQACAGIELTCF